MMQTFYSNGKLLLSGEYLVLDGGTALAVPTKFGQNLTIQTTTSNYIEWKSLDVDATIWFEETISFDEIIKYKDPDIETIHSTLVKILHEAFKMNASFLQNDSGYKITTKLGFSRKWGLGTSSTLINNIAQWLQIDPFALLNKSFGGSGYDIACAQNDTPILYKIFDAKPQIISVAFDPPFKENLYFLYLNQKQSSKTAIANYRKRNAKDILVVSEKIDLLTQKMIAAQTLEEFQDIIARHETKLSYLLETSTIKEALFSNFKGEIKSLGAWGGDFVLVATAFNPKEYFAEKGFLTLIPYSEMILE